MKRRNFFGSLAGLIAAPVAAKAIDELAKNENKASIVKEVIVEKKELGKHVTRYRELEITCCSGMMSDFDAKWDRNSEEVCCDICAEELPYKAKFCPHCGSEVV